MYVWMYSVDMWQNADKEMIHTTLHVTDEECEFKRCVISACLYWCMITWQWRHNGRDGVSNHQPHCLHSRLFRWRLRKASKLRVTGLCAGNSPVTGEFHAQMASNTENVYKHKFTNVSSGTLFSITENKTKQLDCMEINLPGYPELSNR